MPRGTYAIVRDGDEVAVESFSSAPGPMGWRYYSTVAHVDGGLDRIDLSVDARGRAVRARIETAEHELMIVVRGEGLGAVRDGNTVELDHPAGMPLSYPSPGFYAVALHRLDAGINDVVLSIDPETLEVAPQPRAAELLGEAPVATPAGAFDARRWRVDGREVTIADTVVLTVEDLAELRTYERGASGPQPRLHGL